MTTTPLPGSDFIQSWANRQHASVRNSPRSRRFLLIAIKVSLLFAGLCFLVLVFLWGSGAPNQKADSVPDQGQILPRNEMTDPRLVGIDANGYRYEISARRAFENHGAKHVIYLDGLKASFYDRKGKEVTLEAREGRYDVSERRAILNGNIRMGIQWGTVVEATSAEYDVGRGIAKSDAPVSIHGPWGDMEAQAFHYRPAEGLLELTGRPVLRIRELPTQ